MAQVVPARFHMNKPHLFIDGRNTAYRAIYANRDGAISNLLVMLRFIRQWLRIHEPSSVHVFWDAPRETVWRRDIFTGYKDRPDNEDSRNIRNELANLQAAAMDVLSFMNVRQYSKPRQEADDLIYAACRNIHPYPAVIVSSDGDFLQIPFYMGNVRVWEPRKGIMQEVTPYNPVIRKCLMGDDSDCIDGYDGIGPVKSKLLAESPGKLNDFLATAGRRCFLMNMLLVDLALCPFLLANQMYVARQWEAPLSYNPEAIIGLVGKHNLSGIIKEFDRTIAPFRALSTMVG